MADDVTFTFNADSTPPGGTIAATDEITVAGPHLNAHAGIAKLAVSADGDGTHLPATATDGLLVDLGANNDVTVTGTVTSNPGTTIAAADNLANPTTGEVISYLVGFDSAAWDRLRTVSAIGDGSTGVGLLAGGNYVFNGVSWDREQVHSDSSALTTVADNAASTTLLAANSARVKATITNDSSARLYVRFEAAAASTSNYGISLAQHETWEELTYRGEIRGIWATDPGDGAARITEFV